MLTIQGRDELQIQLRQDCPFFYLDEQPRAYHNFPSPQKDTPRFPKYRLVRLSDL